MTVSYEDAVGSRASQELSLALLKEIRKAIAADGGGENSAVLLVGTAISHLVLKMDPMLRGLADGIVDVISKHKGKTI